jgi:hypothetical protein
MAPTNGWEPERSDVRFRTLAATAAMLGLAGAAIPTTAFAGSEYFAASAGNWVTLYAGYHTYGARHSLTRISVRSPGTAPDVCVYGKDENNASRNTAYYCIVTGTLAETPTLAGTSLRYPWVENFSNALAYDVRALSEW